MVAMFCVMFLLVFYITTARSDMTRSYKVSMVATEHDMQTPARYIHGESPVWDSERQCLLFVDVLAQKVLRLDYDTGRIFEKQISYGQVNVVTTVANSNRLLVAVRAGLYLLDWDVEGDRALRPLTAVDLGQPDNVINEGKADVDGRFWAGTKGPQIGEEVLPDRAALYSVTQHTLAAPAVRLKPVSISNGLVWALNNTVFYYIDSNTQRIDAYDYDVSRAFISNRRTIIDVTEYGYTDAIPDGMTIDSVGNLWVALLRAGTILHINPDARHVIYGYKLPVSRTTSVAWGGPNLDELFVTTSRVGVDESAEPLAGAVFTIRDTGSRGVPHHHFRLDNADFY